MGKTNLADIGKRIQIRRKQLGYTQEQLASMMDVSIQMISNLERGNKAVRIENLVTLSHILNVSTDYILTGSGTSCDFQTLAERIARLSETDRNMIELLVNYCAKKTM